jgi:hypothetical protein
MMSDEMIICLLFEALLVLMSPNIYSFIVVERWFYEFQQEAFTGLRPTLVLNFLNLVECCICPPVLSPLSVCARVY